MKISINLAREYMGGIAAVNVNFINYLYRLNNQIIGIELNGRMHMKGPVIFRNFSPELFDHNIINVHHLPIDKVLQVNHDIESVEHAYKEQLDVIRKIFKEAKPDVILINGTYYFPWLISVAAEQEKIPIMLWYSGVLSREYKEKKDYTRQVLDIFLAIERSILKRASETVFPSELCRKVVEEEVLGAKVKNSHVIPNPVSDLFVNPSFNHPMENNIAIVGRYSAIKNSDRFFDLHKELVKKNWKHNAFFVTNASAEDLKKFPKEIKVLPSMNPEELKKFYLSQGLIVSPSKFETFGNVAMEAICLGVPVLVSENMGCAEILRKAGLDNMIMSFDDIGKVADRVQELCGQPVPVEKINFIRKMLDNDTVSKKVYSILQETAKNR